VLDGWWSWWGLLTVPKITMQSVKLSINVKVKNYKPNSKELTSDAIKHVKFRLQKRIYHFM